jgi:putative ABC transport system ATP-binding protein
MLQPTSGHVQRNGTVGFVFQTLELLPYLTVRENIALGLSPKQRDEDRLEHLLDLLQLRARASHRPHELSVGESQRTATARALVGNPALLLADEPTGNLDSENANLVLMAIREHANNSGAVLVASHGPTDALQPTRTLHLAAGTVADSRASTA